MVPSTDVVIVPLGDGSPSAARRGTAPEVVGEGVVDLPGETPAEVAVEATLAMIEGATALRTADPTAARRAATVVAAVVEGRQGRGGRG